MARGKVLVVEEESQSRQGLARLLDNRDLLVEQAPSGELAVRKVEQEAYDIVFLDLGLPKMDGRTVLNRLLAARPDLCVVILAAEGTIGAAVQAMKRGAFHYLTKPVDATALDVLIRNGLERSQLIQQNATLRQEALLDDQTTAYNRRFMETYLEEELERARRYGRPFSLIFFDLDHLKKVNDQYGHLCGSRVLRELAQLALRKLRKSDKMFRFGGDEFVVTLPETDAKGAFVVAQRIRRAVKAHRFEAEGGSEVTLTASFGVATYPYDGKNHEALLRRADAAMYRVKSSTRDGVGAGDEG